MTFGPWPNNEMIAVYLTQDNSVNPLVQLNEKYGYYNYVMILDKGYGDIIKAF